jgi:RNA polymerase sigma-70 factor (ECF subfamily)
MMAARSATVACQAQLLQQLAAHLDDHFEQVVLLYQDALYRFAWRLCGSTPDAEEIAQDTFVSAYRALARYPAPRVRALQLRPWLYRIALNIARNRRRRRRPELVPLEAAGARLRGEARAEEQPERRALDAERRLELQGLLAALPAPYRVAVVLRHMEGFGYRELAALLRQPVGTVKSNVHRGTRQLRAALMAQEQEVSIS